MIRAAVVVVLVAGCWRGDVPAPAPTPAPAATKPTPRWRAGHASAYTRSSQSPGAVASELETELRSGMMAPMLVPGPTVMLDLDTTAITTECGANAFFLAHRLDVLFSDPSRGRIACRPTSPTTFTCAQLSSQPIVIAELASGMQWRLVSVIVGSGRPYVGAKMAQFRNQIATATCP